jgi:hypothetical protein
MERKVTDVNNYGIKEDAVNFNFILNLLLRYIPNEQLEKVYDKLYEDKKRYAIQVANDTINGVADDWCPSTDSYRNVRYLIDRVDIGIKSKCK